MKQSPCWRCSANITTRTKVWKHYSVSSRRRSRSAHAGIWKTTCKNLLAKKEGMRYVRTHNDSKNAPMLAINRKLGYKPEPGYYRLLRVLEVDYLVFSISLSRHRAAMRALM